MHPGFSFKICIASGNTDKAIAFLKSAVQSQPKDATLAQMLGAQLIIAARGRPLKVDDLAFLQTAVRSYSGDIGLTRTLAEQLVVAADELPADERQRALLDGARHGLNSVVGAAELGALNDPGNRANLLTFGLVHQQLCYCLVQLGRREEAIAGFRRLVYVQKSLEPRPAIDPDATDAYWREIAKTILTMRPLLAPQPTLSSDDFVRNYLSEMHFQSQSEGHFGWLLILAEGDLAAQMRRVGHSADAKQQVAQMMKYASRLVARNPNDLLAHLALSEAQIHVAKNAQRNEDGNPRAALRQALDSAERALAISPNNAKARAAVADCRRRLERIASAS